MHGLTPELQDRLERMAKAHGRNAADELRSVIDMVQGPLCCSVADAVEIAWVRHAARSG